MLNSSQMDISQNHYFKQMVKPINRSSNNNTLLFWHPKHRDLVIISPKSLCQLIFILVKSSERLSDKDSHSWAHPKSWRQYPLNGKVSQKMKSSPLSTLQTRTNNDMIENLRTSKKAPSWEETRLLWSSSRATLSLWARPLSLQKICFNLCKWRIKQNMPKGMRQAVLRMMRTSMSCKQKKTLYRLNMRDSLRRRKNNRETKIRFLRICKTSPRYLDKVPPRS